MTKACVKAKGKGTMDGMKGCQGSQPEAKAVMGRTRGGAGKRVPGRGNRLAKMWR